MFKTVNRISMIYLGHIVRTGIIPVKNGLPRLNDKGF